LKHSFHDELAPVTEKDWGWYDFLSYWMTDVHSIGGYVMAGTLFTLGLPPGQVFLALVFGSVLVCVFATLVAVPSQRDGVPFAVAIREAFGIRGGMVPAGIRALIAMAWYGIQTWLASNAVCLLLVRLVPGLAPYAMEAPHGFLGLSRLGWACFLLLWAVQLVIFRRGVETIRRFFDLAGPAVYGVMVALLLYLFACNHWRWPSLAEGATHGQFLLWVNATALVVAYFSGPMLNFGDYARKGRSMRQVALGNFLGLPLNFVFFAAISVATTALTLPVFGESIDDPVALVGRIGNPAILAMAILTFLLAAAGINIAANFVSGVLDLCALAPRRLDWSRAGWLFSLGAIALTPWNLYRNPAQMHLTLDILAAAVGPLFGILVVECFVTRNARTPRGPAGRLATSALAVGGLAALLPEFTALLSGVQNFSWFVGALVGGCTYALLSATLRRSTKTMETSETG